MSEPAGTRRFLFPLLALGIGLVGALLAGEVAVRLLTVDVQGMPFHPSEEGQLGLIPGATGRYSLTEEGVTRTFEYAINAEGFRDRAPAGPRRPGVARVAVLGDSFVAGFAAPQDGIFPRVAARVLGAGGAEVEVLSYGVPAYGTGMQLQILEEFVLPKRPDLVVHCFFGNDPWDNTEGMKQWYRPRYRVGEGGALEELPPFPEARRRREKVRRGLGKFLNERSRLYRWQKRKMAALMRILKSEVLEVDREVPRALEVVTVPPPESVREGWGIVKACIREMRDRCRAAGVRFAVMGIPFQELVSPAREARSRRIFPALEDHVLDWDPAATHLAPFLARAGIPYLDLVPVLRTDPDPTRFYYEVDGHFTPAGHEFVGTALARWLEEQDLVSPSGER